MMTNWLQMAQQQLGQQQAEQMGPPQLWNQTAAPNPLGTSGSSLWNGQGVNGTNRLMAAAERNTQHSLPAAPKGAPRGSMYTQPYQG